MRIVPRSTLGQTIALQYLALVLGIAWWHAATADVLLKPIPIFGGTICPAHALRNWIVPAGVALAIFLAAALRGCTTSPDENRAVAVCVGLAVYVVAVVFHESFLWIGSDFDNMVAVGAIVFPLLGFRVLVARRQWLAVCGLILFIATCIASMLCNAGFYTHGDGFLSCWVS